ncbi:MAG: hypothetical protein ACOC32_04805 [Nanoarchaeota archaeon]
MNFGSKADFTSVYAHHSRLRSRRAQRDAGSAANLVALLGVFIILYVLFVPPADRDELLNGGGTDGDDDDDDFDLVSYLINTQPGELHYFYDDDFEHPLPSFYLRESQYSEVLAEENPFSLRRSWFSDARKAIRFDVPSVRQASSLKMSFTVDNEPKGNLIILFNGEEIFNKRLDSGQITPITLPKEMLADSNALDFLLSPPDLAFWEANNYEISGLTVTGDFVDLTTLENSQKFFLEEIEKGNIGEARVLFSPNCNKNTVGKLTIMLNDESIYSAIPDCNALNTVYFDPAILVDSENVIRFSSAQGEYTMSLVNVKTQITDEEYPTYRFELTESTYDKLRSGDQYINVTLEMQDDEQFKEAYLLVNTVKFFIETNDNVYWRKIPDEVLEEGTNTVEIRPLNSFEAIRLKVGLYD